MLGQRFSEKLEAYYLAILYLTIVGIILKENSGSRAESSRIPPELESPPGERQQQRPDVVLPYFVVPLMLLCSSAIMATAWLGHLRFKEDLSFVMATLFAWMLVLPEYALNIKALRMGYRVFTGGQMGAFRLCTGVVCIAFVSHYILGEQFTLQKVLGFGVMALSMVLISNTDKKEVE